jgi:hypothetical protein
MRTGNSGCEVKTGYIEKKPMGNYRIRRTGYTIFIIPAGIIPSIVRVDR